MFFFFVFLLLLRSAAESAAASPPLFSGVELRALFSLRASLGLRSRDWPRKADPCSAWLGVGCSQGRVVALNISGFRRTRLGRLSPAFAVEGLQNLSSLAVFNASDFLLPGPIPDWFGSLLPPSLAVLDLRRCAISGSVPFSLGSSSGLAELYLAGNELTGNLPPSLGRLSNLAALDLAKNKISGEIPPQLGDLPSLVTLDLSDNLLSGGVPENLGNLRSLIALQLSGNSLSGSLPESLFRGFSSPRSLNLSRNNFSDRLPSSVWGLRGLQFLDLSVNNFTGALPLGVPELGEISGVLNLSRNSLFGLLDSGNGSVFQRFSVVDVSGNFFQGEAPLNASRSDSFALNCFNNTLNQRSSEDCSEFYAARGLPFRPAIPVPNATKPSERSRKGSNLKYILGGVFGGVGLVFLLLLLLFVFCRKPCCVAGAAKRKEESEATAPPGESPLPAVLVNIAAVGDSFTLDQILLATGNFDEGNLIKHGHSGDLYRGFLEGGVPVVVKRVFTQESKKETYLAELDFFAKHSSSRIVPFIGHCLTESSQKILVYKFMPHGDLSSSLFLKSGQEGEGLMSLDWITRLKIAIGVAEALCYLHHECSPPLVHRDIQASSILLDERFEVRLGSLSEVCPQEGEPHQSVITRFLRKTSDVASSGAASSTCAYDVYCLGKVLLELVTGKLGISGSNDASTIDWLEKTLPYINIEEKELVTRILDPSLVVDDDLLEEVWAMAIVARSCLNPKPSRRPLIRYILKALENPLKVVRQEPPSTSGRLRTTSSRGSWNAALFGSWRQSSSDMASLPGPSKEGPSLKLSGNSQGSNGGEQSSSRRKPSKEIFPEPSDPHAD
ncbi:putative LRR receptor-like serine/threonine-protein kinase At2g16250 [Wolffia australiana]